MKISARAEVSKEIFEKESTYLKEKLRQNLCEELIKHNVFIEPPINEIDGNISIEAHFYALSYTDINDLKELIKYYPEISKIIKNIIFDNRDKRNIAL